MSDKIVNQGWQDVFFASNAISTATRDFNEIVGLLPDFSGPVDDPETTGQYLDKCTLIFQTAASLVKDHADLLRNWYLNTKARNGADPAMGTDKATR